MFNIILKKRNILILVIVLIALFLILGRSNVSASSQLTSIKGNINEVSKETLEILLALKSLKLDNSIFEDIAFKELIDFSIELDEKELGRNNPFEDFMLDIEIEE